MEEPRKCDRCDEDAIQGGRYCKSCKRQVMAEMREAGYLGYNPRIGYRLKPGQKHEVERDWNGGLDNGVRAIEDQ